MKSIEILSNTDRTCLSRIIMAARFYLAPAKWQLWAFPLLSIVLFALFELVGDTNLFLSSIISGPLNWAIVFAPLALGARQGREVEYTLPVLGVEKCVVILGYCLIVVPILLIFPFQLGCYIFHGCSSFTLSLNQIPQETKEITDFINMNLAVGINIMSYIAYIATCLWGVFRASRKRIMWGFLAVAICYGVVIAGSMIISFVAGFVIGINNMDGSADHQAIVREVAGSLIPMYLRIVAVIIGIYTIFALTKCCSAIARRRL